MMKGLFGALTLLAVVAIAVVGYYMVDIEQTQEAKLPNVDVNVEGGQAPQFDVDTKSVDVGLEEKKVTVPEIELQTRETTVQVPTVEVESSTE